VPDIFKPKIPIWVKLAGSCKRCWYVLWPFGIFYGHLVNFMAIWYILWPFGIFYGHLVYLWPFGIFYGHLVYFMAIWYILWPFGTFFPFMVPMLNLKNQATLLRQKLQSFYTAMHAYN
jgi:hypothetical protein